MMEWHFKRRVVMIMPFAIAALFVLMKSLSFDFFGFSQSYLTNLWAVIFYFSVFNPNALSVLKVFILGVCADILLQMPFGISPSMYCFMFFIGHFNRRTFIHATFPFQWVGYTVAAGFLFLLGLILLKVMYGAVPHAGYLTAEYASLVILYPIIAAGCGRINRLIGRYV